MPYELASLVVSIGADRSALAAVLAQTRQELAGVAASGVDVKVNPVAPVQGATASAMKDLQEKMAGLKVPADLQEKIAQVTASMSQSAREAGKVGPEMAGSSSGASKAAAGAKQLAGAAKLATSETKEAGGFLSRLFGGMSAVANKEVKPPQLDEMNKGMSEAAKASQGMFESLSQMTGLNLSNILQLGTLAGLGAAATKLFGDFQQIDTEMAVMPVRLRQAGLAGQEAYEEMKQFRNEVAATGRSTFDQVSDAIDQAMTKGPLKFRAAWKDTVLNAQALSAATGQSIDQSVRLLNLGQQNYTNLGRIFRQVGEQLRPNATQAEYDAALEKIVNRGKAILAAQEDTVSVKLNKVKNVMVMFKNEVAIILGNALKQPLDVIATTVTTVTLVIQQFVADNEQLISVLTRVGGWIMTGVGALLFFKTALFAVKLLLGQVGGMLLGPLKMGLSMLISAATAAGSAIWTGIFSPLVATRIAMQGLLSVIQGALVTTGVGAILVFAAAILQATGAIDWMIDGVKRLMAWFNDGGKGKLFEWLRAGWNSIKNEAAVVMHALGTAWDTLVQTIRTAIDFLMGLFTNLFGVPKVQMSDVVDWAKSKSSEVMDFVFRIWNEFILEISVYGLRLQQYWLMYAVIVENFGTILEWIGDVFRAVLTFIWTLIKDHTMAVVTIVTLGFRLIWAIMKDLFAMIAPWIGGLIKALLETVMGWFKAFINWQVETVKGWFEWLRANWRNVGTIIVNTAKEKFKEFIEWGQTKAREFYKFISDRARLKSGRGVDFSETEKEIEETKKALDEISNPFERFMRDMPKLKLEGEAWDRVQALSKQIDELKNKNRAEFDRIRRQQPAGRTRTPVTPRTQGAGKPSTGRLVRGGFSDLMGQWKKVQEAAVSGQFSTLEGEAKKQTSHQREHNAKLDEANEHLRRLNEGGFPHGGGGPLIPM